MRWFVLIEDQVYGPYSPEQLSPFLKPDTPVTRDDETRWMPAHKDAGLADVLAGRIKPLLEWYYKKGGVERGPVTLTALLAMIERHDIHPEECIRHETWKEFVLLEQTKLFLKWKDPNAVLQNLRPDMMRNDTPTILFVAPTPASRWKEQVRLPRGGIYVLLGGVIVAGFISWNIWNQPVESDPRYRQLDVFTKEVIDPYIKRHHELPPSREDALREYDGDEPVRDMPINMKLLDRTYLLVWDFGPNRIDEGGGGDDISGLQQNGWASR